MKTIEFINQLKELPNHSLVFDYGNGQLVPYSYHITEVKNVNVESVDCGGRPDSYKHTIVQLWVNPLEKKDTPMTSNTATKIFDIVHKMKPMVSEAPIFFEWGTPELRTSVYAVHSTQIEDNRLTVKLEVPVPACKPHLELETVNAILDSSCGCGPKCC